MQQVTDAGLEHLKGLAQLKDLKLNGTQVTDAGLEYLKGLNQLQTLDLGKTQVADAGLERLKVLSQLQELDLEQTRITDAGLETSRREPTPTFEPQANQSYGRRAGTSQRAEPASMAGP